MVTPEFAAYPASKSVYTPAAPPRPVRGFAITVVALLGLWCAVAVLVAVTVLDQLGLVNDIDQGIPVTDAMIDDAEQFAEVAAWTLTGAMLAAAVGYVVWLFRTRANAELVLDPHLSRHRWSRKWLILGWIVPIMNLWVPKQLVDDIWRGSAPPPASGADPLTGPRPGLGYAWWTCFVSMFIGDRMVGIMVRQAERSANLELIKTALVLDLIVLAVGIVAAVLAAMVVWRITGFQEQRRAAHGTG